MREIKFRAWDIEKKFMHTMFIINSKGKPLSFFPERKALKNVVLEQYTGLKDKNGKDIYEGDILRYDDICSDAHILKTGDRQIGVVEFCDGRSALMLRECRTNHKGGRYWEFWDYCLEQEIIGNIHENPEEIKK